MCMCVDVHIDVIGTTVTSVYVYIYIYIHTYIYIPQHNVGEGNEHRPDHHSDDTERQQPPQPQVPQQPLVQAHLTNTPRAQHSPMRRAYPARLEISHDVHERPSVRAPRRHCRCPGVPTFYGWLIISLWRICLCDKKKL